MIKTKEVEVNEKTNQVKQAYERLLKKCSFEKDEDQWLMWGKILHLAQSGYQAIQMEKQSNKEYARLKKEADKDSNKVIPTKLTISSTQIFNDVKKLLDLYLSYNKSRDQNALQYVPAAKKYFELVSNKKIDASGILMVGTENNVTHPILKTGDVVIERKGKVINYVDDYSKLKDDPSLNIVKILRFNSTGKVKMITERLPDTKVLVGFINLKESN